MKKIVALAAAITAFGFASAASAADMPTKAPLMVAPVYNWTGLYIGLNAGGAWNSSGWTDTTGNVIGPGLTSGSRGSGFIGGGQIGYNYQIGQWVLGVEADFDGSSVKSSFDSTASCAGAPPGICTTKQDWAATARARLGYALDHWLVYGTGGVAFSHYSHHTDYAIGPSTTSWDGGSRIGWVAGVGLEYAVTNNWIAGLEWKYYDFGSKTGFAVAQADFMQFKETENSVVARLSYKFGP